MEIVLSFESTLQPIVVDLPDEKSFYDVMDAIRRAVMDEGRKQVVSIVFKTKVAAQVPPHGVIVFNPTETYLNADFEGPWYLYVRDTPNLRACAIALELICNVAHVSLTIDDD